MTASRSTLLDLSREDLEALVAAAGQPRYRADQILAWVHGRDVLDPDAMSNLPRSLRETLRSRLPPGVADTAPATVTSADGTTKLEIPLHDGAGTQTVLIPELAAGEDEDEDDSRVASPGSRVPSPEPRVPTFTQCLSTQVGCAFGCLFCRSGSQGFTRNLSAGEILLQRRLARRALAGRGEIVRTVVMGIGEPLHNLDALLPALRLLTDPRAGAVSPRRVTVSTIGLPDGIRALGEAFAGKLGLAWSLHAADEETRRALLPAASKRPVAEVVAALRAWPLPPRRRITVECVLVGGINDSVRHARDVARLLSGLRCKVNLIPYNDWRTGDRKGAGPRPKIDPATAPDPRAPEPAAVETYRETLAASGLSVFVRKPRGADILAACGQLLGPADLSPGGRLR